MLVAKGAREEIWERVAEKLAKRKGVAPGDYEYQFDLPELFFLVDEDDTDAVLAAKYWQQQDYSVTSRRLVEDKQLIYRTVCGGKSVSLVLGIHVFLSKGDRQEALVRRRSIHSTPYTSLTFFATVLLAEKKEERVRVCLDTGSHLSVVCESFAKRLDMPLVKKDGAIFGLGGGKLQVNYEAVMKLNMGGQAVSVSACVAKRSSFREDLLLGMDMLESCDVQVGLSGKETWIQFGAGQRVRAAVTHAQWRGLEESECWKK